MVYPEMIIFDYGHTLLYEPGFDTLRGEKALLKYVKSSRKTYTAEEINGFAKTIFREISTVRSMGYELHEWQFRKFLYEYLGIEFSIPMP
ncbi:MAG TPA: HAD family hydrolase, partial [Clostridiaceae bacterium]|nr:HAD family hydrolase [Clostridiaceae bacterium]